MYLLSQALIIWSLVTTTLQSQILKGPVQFLYFHSNSWLWAFNIMVVSNHTGLKLGACFSQPRCNLTFFVVVFVLKTLFKSVQLFIIWRFAKIEVGVVRVDRGIPSSSYNFGRNKACAHFNITAKQQVDYYFYITKLGKFVTIHWKSTTDLSTVFP